MDEPDDILEDYNDELVSGLFHTEDVTPDLDLSPSILEDAELEQASRVDSDRGQLEGDDAKSQASKLGASAKSKPSPQPSSVQFDSNINSIHWSRFVCSIFGRMVFGQMYLQMKVLCSQIYLKV